MKNQTDNQDNGISLREASRGDIQWYWLRWLGTWGSLADGLTGVLTVGFWITNMESRANTWFLDYSDDLMRRKLAQKPRRTHETT